MRAKAARAGRTTRNHEEIRVLIATVTSRDAEIGPILQRPLQHAERMMSAVDSDAARASRPDQVSHGGTEAQRQRGLASHPLRAARVRTEGAMFLSVPPCLRERLPHRTQHATGGRNHECPSDGVRTK